MAAQVAKVFYSWQAKWPAACRNLILEALEDAVRMLRADATLLVEPVVDRDTAGVAGSPDIGATIFGKIDTAAVFVADVTIIQSPDGGRPTPNPNVLVELGYALKALGPSRIILVQNELYGGPELLPFDLRGRRTLKYSSPDSGYPSPEEGTRGSDRRKLQRDLEYALRAVLGLPTPEATPAKAPEFELTLSYKRDPRSDGKVHWYELLATLKNLGTRRIDDWELEVDFPAALINPDIINGARVSSPSDESTARFRTKSSALGPLRFRGEVALTVSYMVNEQRYQLLRDGLYERTVTAWAHANGELRAQTSKQVSELVNY
jgi:hypothetical protein